MTNYSANPFADSIVTDPWEPSGTDVPQIHAHVFDICVSLLQGVRQTGKNSSLLVLGSPGSGKTHVLRRLREKVAGGSLAKTANRPSKPQAIFCAVRLATGPGMVRRLVLRRLVNDLLRNIADGVSQLEFALLDRLSRHKVSISTAAETLQGIRKSSTYQANLAALLTPLRASDKFGRNLIVACEHLLLGRHRTAVSDWLSNGELSDEECELLDIEPASADEDPEQTATQQILRLLRLVGPSYPVLLCFDQIEAMQRSTNDGEGLFQFGRMVADLFDEGAHTLFMTCAQSSFAGVLNSHVLGADSARLRQHERTINPLTSAEAEELAKRRLNDSPQFRDDPHRAADQLWPIGTERLRQFCQSGNVTPRGLIKFCKDTIDGQPVDVVPTNSGESTPPSQETAYVTTDGFLRNDYEKRIAKSLGALEDSQNTLVHGLACLVDVAPEAAQLEQVEKPPHVDLALKAKDRRVNVSVCNARHNTLAARLRGLRLLQKQDQDKADLVLVRDSTRAISKTAKKSLENWQALAKDGARIVRPTAEALAALEALRMLLSDAQAGDLACDGETVPPQTVRDWLRAHLDPELERLAAEIVHQGVAPPGDDRFDELLELVQQSHVVSLKSLAEQLHQPEPEIAACLRAHEAEFGLIGEPAVAVFERTYSANHEGS